MRCLESGVENLEECFAGSDHSEERSAAAGLLGDDLVRSALKSRLNLASWIELYGSAAVECGVLTHKDFASPYCLPLLTTSKILSWVVTSNFRGLVGILKSFIVM